MKIVTCTLAALSAFQIAAAQAPEVKTAEQVYKNIQQLKGTPADQLPGAMQFIAASLGVECDTCHVAGKFEADDKNTKKTAREMMSMVAMINKESFRGQRQVTCNTCHRGSLRPVSVPPVMESDAPPSATAAAAPAAGTPAPTVDDIINKYLAAAGGADTMKNVTSRAMKGAVMAMGSDSAIDLFTKAPNKRLSISHMSPTSDSYTAFDGTVGWLATTGRPAREMNPTEAFAASLDADFYLVAAGSMCETINATKPGQPAVTLYFDQKTGLLSRMVRSADTSMGRLPTQVDYADYRETDGVKIPWRWTLARVNGRFTIQLKEVKNNVAIDDAKFAKPAGDMK
jgi:photosynthetic reaction center cytochrome c subunit